MRRPQKPAHPPELDSNAALQAIQALQGKQLEVFEQICLGNDADHPRKSLKHLLGVGLILEYQEQVPVFGIGTAPLGRATRRRYTVPIHIHAVWCEWAASQLSPEEVAQMEAALDAPTLH